MKIKKEDLLKMINSISESEELKEKFLNLLVEVLDLRKNPFHSLVFIINMMLMNFL